ncbi:MAG: hypothetical protein IJA85_01855 [Clostridia bacterium]|nr:hypothetical protein [Clostridia bacterium]
MKNLKQIICSILLMGMLLVGCDSTNEPAEIEETNDAATEAETEVVELGDIKLADLYPVSETESVIEVTDGITPYLNIISTNGHLAYGYYNKNYFVDSYIFVGCEGARLVAADLNEKVVYNLGISCGGISTYLVYGEKIYYSGGDQRTLSVFDIRTGVNEVVYTFDYTVGGFIEVTNDGRYISLTTYACPEADGMYRATIFDMEKREIVDIFDYLFEGENPVANHHMICPTDHTKLFFAHEGDTTKVPDRLWMYEIGKEPYCIVDQQTKVLKNGKVNVVDCCGHEAWSYDGKGLWYVKYGVSPRGPKGICYIDLSSSDKSVDVKFSSYAYWHTSCSPDGKYVAGDTQEVGPSKVVLINLATGEENVLLDNVLWIPGTGLDPHPGFSRNSEMYMFENANSDTGYTSVGVIRIADVKWSAQ